MTRSSHLSDPVRLRQGPPPPEGLASTLHPDSPFQGPHHGLSLSSESPSPPPPFSPLLCSPSSPFPFSRENGLHVCFLTQEPASCMPGPRFLLSRGNGTVTALLCCEAKPQRSIDGSAQSLAQQKFGVFLISLRNPAWVGDGARAWCEDRRRALGVSWLRLFSEQPSMFPGLWASVGKQVPSPRCPPGGPQAASVSRYH